MPTEPTLLLQSILHCCYDRIEIYIESLIVHLDPIGPQQTQLMDTYLSFILFINNNDVPSLNQHRAPQRLAGSNRK